MLLFSAPPGAWAARCAAGRNSSGRNARIEARILVLREWSTATCMIRFRPTLNVELRHGEEAEQTPVRSGRRRRPGSRAPLAPPAAGARHHAGRLRGARRLPPPAPLPARAHAPVARGLRARRDAV